MKMIQLFSVFCLVFLSMPVYAQLVAVHKLRVAAHPSVDITNEDVDEIIMKMNDQMRATSYPWDPACADVRFARDGDVLRNNNLLTAGTFENLNKNRNDFARDYNVVAVLGVYCAGVVAAGCGPVGAEPVIVKFLGGPSAYYNPQLWLHERGHNVGLKHSAESPVQDGAVNSEIGKRFMFWQLGDGHVGKTYDECMAFRRSELRSIAHESIPEIRRASSLPKEMVALASMMPGASALVDSEPQSIPSASVLPTDDEIAARMQGLTPRAYRVIAAPWVGSYPKEAVAELDDTDLNSIRQLLSRPNAPYVSQAVQVLGERGSRDDIPLLQSWVETPLPAAIPGDNSKENRDAMRQLKQAKIAAPSALSQLAQRLSSDTAIEILKNASSAAAVVAPADPAVTAAAQKSAIFGLSTINKENAQDYVKSVIRLQDQVQLSTKVKKNEIEAARAVPLSTDERKNLRDALIQK